jgi:hypothetical protein
MYPHERSLVASMQGRSFALLGVNSDKKERVQEAMKRENITWRSWWDGGSTRGPISSYYGIRGWPTIFVVDHQGRIRYKNVRGEKMTEAIEVLLAEAESASEEDAHEYPIVGTLGPQLRKWTDTSGSHTLRASFVKFRDGKAHLRKENGEVIQVSMNLLSSRDQEFIRDTLRANREKK